MSEIFISIDLYKKIHIASGDTGDVYVLYHMDEKGLPAQIKELKHMPFSNDIISKLNYFPIGFNLIPGNNHFPLLQFYFKAPKVYNYYWCIEEDVRFSGNWQYFFNSFSSINKDFISCHIRLSREEPLWHWWPSLAHPYTAIPFEERIRSFNPIYRISSEALGFIHEALLSHWCGHHEVLFPTLLSQEGFEIMDFGGEGHFVPSEFVNKFYIPNTTNKHGALRDGSMRWRPIFEDIGNEKNKLYHPVKDVDK